MLLGIKDLRACKGSRLALVRHTSMQGVGTKMGSALWGDPFG